jgi:hypothetical protein
MKYVLGAIFVAACFAALPACQWVNPCPSLFLAVDYTLVYPINGATSVPDAPGTIVLSQLPSLNPTGPRLVLIPLVSGPSIVSGPPVPVPSPLPTPHDSPRPTLVAFAVPALAARTAYRVSFRGTQGTSCINPLVGSGSFTTK